MCEAFEIMRRLLDGERLSLNGRYYRTDRAKLDSRPSGDVPIWMAAGGPKSASLAGSIARGIITSVRDPADTMELRIRADGLPREEALGRHPLANRPRRVETYRSLVEEVEADVVTLQIASRDQEQTIGLLGDQVIPKLRAL